MPGPFYFQLISPAPHLQFHEMGRPVARVKDFAPHIKKSGNRPCSGYPILRRGGIYSLKSKAHRNAAIYKIIIAFTDISQVICLQPVLGV